MLDAELDEYIWLTPEPGFLVMPHQPGVPEDFTRDGVYVPLGFTTYIALTKVKEALYFG